MNRACEPVTVYSMTDNPEADYRREVSRAHRKRLGQFFTPFEISEVMAKWVLDADVQEHRIVDPAVGLGVFPRALNKHTTETIEIICYDVDEIILERCKSITCDLNNAVVSYNLGDFLETNGESYTGFICNPPYLKFHDYDNLDSIDSLERSLGVSLSGYSNISVLFILKCLHQLESGGRMAFIVPTDFMNTGYGVAVKELLCQEGSIRHIIQFDDSESLFGDAMVTSCILLFEKERTGSKVTFSQLSIDWKEDLGKILAPNEDENQITQRVLSISELDPSIKWSTYLSNPTQLNEQNLCNIADYGKFKRGIATGANNYFTFNKTKAEEEGIFGEDFLKVCICKSMDVQSDYFTLESIANLSAADRPIFLLDATEEDAMNQSLKKYLDKAEGMGVTDRYLVRNRAIWHQQEQKPPAKIWASVFNRNRVKFIRNRANALHLTTFHGFYPSSGISDEDIDVLFAYLLTDISREIIQRNQRNYGMGLKKYEPNDLNNAPVIRIENIPPLKRKQILSLAREHEEKSEQERPNLVLKLEIIFESLLR
jgi:adenine-specific DNA-methyltransferase